MSRQSIIVIDDFYDDPLLIRELALSLPFQKKAGATYPGAEAVADRDWSDERGRLRTYIEEACDAPCPKNPPFPQGKFRLAVGEDQRTRIDRCHVDQQRWSGIVYLTLDENCDGGLALYRHRPTASIEWDESWFRSYFALRPVSSASEHRAQVLNYFADPANFEQIGLVPMVFNRAVLLMAHTYHGTGVAFGDSARSGRLTQHFEFYS